MATKTKSGPERTGSLYWTKSGWRVRLRVEIDGEVVQKSFDLETTDKAVAKLKMRRLVKQQASGQLPTEEQAKAPTTVAEFYERWIERRKTLGIRATEYEERFMVRVWLPAFGHLPLGDVTKPMVQDVLDRAATGEIRPRARHEDDQPEPYSRQSIAHMRATVVRLFQAAWKDELIAENKAAKTDVPDVEEETKPRTVLTDAEIGQLVACPEADAEIKVLLLMSRTIGGLRAGDLNQLDWTAFSPGFATCTFIRRKTRKKKPAPQTLIVPAVVRPFIEAWWERQKKPAKGPVFPVRKGKRAGLQKKASNMSYADRLRRELWKAGVRRHELHVETATTLPTDFHSLRRAYGTALARVGVNEQTAMVLTGHSDSKVHRRYLESLTRELPAAAIPELSTDHAQLLRNTRTKITDSASFSERDTGFEPATPSLGSDFSAENRGNPSQLEKTEPVADGAFSRDLRPRCTVRVHSSRALAVASDAALAAYLRTLAGSIAQTFVTRGGSA